MEEEAERQAHEGLSRLGLKRTGDVDTCIVQAVETEIESPSCSEFHRFQFLLEEVAESSGGRASMWNITVMLQPQLDHVGCGLFRSQFSAVPLLVPARPGELWVYEAATAMHCGSCRFSSVWVIKRLVSTTAHFYSTGDPTSVNTHLSSGKVTL